MIKINLQMIRKSYESKRKKDDPIFSQFLMSKKLDIEPNKLSRILTGKKKSIDLIILIKISIFCGLPINYFTNIKEIENKLKKKIK